MPGIRNLVIVSSLQVALAFAVNFIPYERLDCRAAFTGGGNFFDIECNKV